MAAPRGARGRRALGVLGGLTVLAGLLTAPAATAEPPQQPQPQPRQIPVAQKPYLGWSSWSLESTNYPGVNPAGPASWLTEQHVLQQADLLAAKFKQHGYTYVNIDAGWVGSFDQYARPVVNPTTFPDGMAHVDAKGLKLGSYLAVGWTSTPTTTATRRSTAPRTATPATWSTPTCARRTAGTPPTRSTSRTRAPSPTWTPWRSCWPAGASTSSSSTASAPAPSRAARTTPTPPTSRRGTRRSPRPAARWSSSSPGR